MILKRIAAAALVAMLAATASAAEPPPRQARALAVAMDEVRESDWDAAVEAAEAAGAVGRDVVEWHRLRAGRGTFAETLEFLERRPDWPGLPLLRQRSERNIPPGAAPEQVIAFFEAQPPRTAAGSLALADAYAAVGRSADAEAQIVLAWVSKPMSEGQESAVLYRYAPVVKDHHVDRLDAMLWAGYADQAERMLPRVSEGWQKLAAARIALRDKKPGVDTLIAAVPQALADDPGLAYERFRWRADKGRYESAIELALSRAAAEDPLGRPDIWAGWRKTLARWAMREGRIEDAYLVAAGHGLSEGSDFAELEWLAGYVALSQLVDPELALFHFQRFRVAVSSPISLGRAGYWEGRAHEAMGNPEGAAQAYAFGAEHQTSFYGLLAAERAGVPMDPALAGTQRFPASEDAPFRRSSVFDAALLLRAAGERPLSERFLAHLAESLDEIETGQLAEFALEIEAPHLALTIAKRGAQYGNVIHAAYFPVVDMGAAHPDVPRELALAVARRESEFDPGAVSGAGARGLMQVMPGTAEDVARELGIEYDRGRLTSDPVYNATLGTAYLAGLIERFGHNYVLVAAGYNAGPGRPIRWIEERGDPRSAGTDVIDWIEHIPFTETRNYVMRVMESVVVYRARLAGGPVPIRLSEELGAR